MVPGRVLQLPRLVRFGGTAQLHRAASATFNTRVTVETVGPQGVARQLHFTALQQQTPALSTFNDVSERFTSSSSAPQRTRINAPVDELLEDGIAYDVRIFGFGELSFIRRC